MPNSTNHNTYYRLFCKNDIEKLPFNPSIIEHFDLIFSTKNYIIKQQSMVYSSSI